VPFDGGTAIQEDPGRPVFRGNGPDDYVCVSCGNVLAVAMQPMQMTYKVRVRWGAARPSTCRPPTSLRPRDG